MLDLFFEIEPILKASLEDSLYGGVVIFDKFSLNSKEVISIRNLSLSLEYFSIFNESITEFEMFAFFDKKLPKIRMQSRRPF